MKKIGKNFIRYESKNGKLDNEKGPALIEYKEDGEEYSEWWRAGKLLAVFNAGVLKRTLENTYDSLKEVLLPKKYEGVETTLSCNDIEQLQIKEQNIIYSTNSSTISNPHKNVTDNKLAVAFHPDAIKILQKEEIPFITDNYEPKFNENLKTEKKYVNLGHDIKVEEKLPNGLRHCNDGPALTMNGEEYLEWWDKGRLVATYDKKNGKLKRSIDGTFSGLKTANLKDKWKGHEVTLSLHDVSLCEFKPELIEYKAVELYPEMKDNYQSKLGEDLETNREVIKLPEGVLIEHRLNDGTRHRNDGPAMYAKKGEYLEWWDKGRLVATYEDGKLMRSIDGTFHGLKEAEIKDKWKNHMATLSLHDVSLCGFKPELVELSKLKIEKDVKIDNDEITKRIEKIRDGGFLVNEPVVKLKK